MPLIPHFLHPASVEGVIVLASSVCVCVCLSVRLTILAKRMDIQAGISACPPTDFLTTSGCSSWYYFWLHFRVPLHNEKGIAIHFLCETSCPPRTIHYHSLFLTYTSRRKQLCNTLDLSSCKTELLGL